MIFPEQKRRYVQLRKRGSSQAEAMAVVGISRQAAWRIDKAEDIGREPKKDPEPEPAPLHDRALQELEDDRREVIPAISLRPPEAARTP